MVGGGGRPSQGVFAVLPARCARHPGAVGRTLRAAQRGQRWGDERGGGHHAPVALTPVGVGGDRSGHQAARSEEHTSELQSHSDLVCRLLLEKKKKEYY